MNFFAISPMRAALAVVWSAGLCCGSAALAEAEDTDASNYDDCTRIELDLEAGAGALTAEEKIAQMDREFYESLARFDRCQASFSSNDGGGGDGGGGGGGGGGDSGGGDGGDGGGDDGGGDDGDGSDGARGGGQDNGVQSVPSASVSGTEPEEPSQEAAEPGAAASQPATAGDTSAPQDTRKTPDDIPSADNDGIIARGLREAAQNEKDPEEREKLWNEYRKYKNLPVKKPPAREQSQ